MKKRFNLKAIIIRLPFIPVLLFLTACTPTPAPKPIPVTKFEPFQSGNVPKDVGEAVLLNVNGYDFLYMYPLPPFKSDGRIFVPLDRFLATLEIGTTYTYGTDVTQPPLSVVISKDRIEAEITNDSKVTITNTKTGEVTTPNYSETEKVWREFKDNLNSIYQPPLGIYVALDIFIDAFKVDAKYDAESNTLYVVSKESEFPKYFRLDDDIYKVQPTPIIRPIKANLELTNQPKHYEDSAFRLTLYIQAADDYTGTAEDISVALIGFYPGARVRFAGDSLTKPFTCQNGTKKNTFICVEDFPPDEEFKSPLWYIFSRIGVRIK